MVLMVIRIHDWWTWHMNLPSIFMWIHFGSFSDFLFTLRHLCRHIMKSFLLTTCVFILFFLWYKNLYHTLLWTLKFLKLVFPHLFWPKWFKFTELFFMFASLFLFILRKKEFTRSIFHNLNKKRKKRKSNTKNWKERKTMKGSRRNTFLLIFEDGKFVQPS